MWGRFLARLFLGREDLLSEVLRVTLSSGGDTCFPVSAEGAQPRLTCSPHLPSGRPSPHSSAVQSLAAWRQSPCPPQHPRGFSTSYPFTPFPTKISFSAYFLSVTIIGLLFLPGSVLDTKGAQKKEA